MGLCGGGSVREGTEDVRCNGTTGFSSFPVAAFLCLKSIDMEEKQIIILTKKKDVFSLYMYHLVKRNLSRILCESPGPVKHTVLLAWV